MLNMRFSLSLLTLLCFATITFAQDKDDKYRSHKRSNRSISVSTNDHGPSDSCNERVRIYSDDYAETQRAEESRNFPNQPMKVTASRNGGIQVHTWDKPEISVKVCKAAAAKNLTTAKALLEQIKLNVSGNTITVDGPAKGGDQDDDYSWSSVILINAPAGATFDLSAHNGGIAVKRFTGNVTAETVNGGISLDQSSGKLDVHATNGGISIKDCGGNVKANVQNGGLSIDLAETWKGEGLEAHTRNGGLMVSVPKGMQSGVEVSMTGHGAVVCQADACSVGQRTWNEEGKTIRFGTGATVVRASTVNGGTVIKERGRKMGKL